MLQIFFRSYENISTDSWAALPDLHFVLKLITALNSSNSGFSELIKMHPVLLLTLFYLYINPERENKGKMERAKLQAYLVKHRIPGARFDLLLQMYFPVRYQAEC